MDRPYPGSLASMLVSDLVRLVGAAISLIGLGLVMGISPTTIAVSFRVLTDVPRAKRAMGFMLLGLILGATVILLALQVIDPHTLETLVSRDIEKVLVRHSVDLAAGALFLTAGIIMAVRLRRPPKPKRPHRKPTGKAGAMVLIGISNTVISFSDFATMYIVARIVRAVSEDIAVRGVKARTDDHEVGGKFVRDGQDTLLERMQIVGIAHTRARPGDVDRGPERIRAADLVIVAERRAGIKGAVLVAMQR